MGKSLIRLCWTGGLAWIAAACAGAVATENGSPAGGSSGAAAQAAEAGAPAHAAGSSGAPEQAAEGGAAGVESPDGGAVKEDEPQCKSKLKEVSNAFGFACPQEFCAALLLATDCAALPGGVTKTIAQRCGDYVDDLSLTFQLSPTQLKVCYYGSDPYDADATLIGAEIRDDAADFCGGTTHRIQGGHVRKACTGLDSSTPLTLCDLSGPEQPKPDDNVPARACFNKFSRSCQPCCAETAPDCSDKPTGYPGYDCTPVGSSNPDEQSMEKNPWCSCSCYEAEWTCLC